MTTPASPQKCPTCATPVVAGVSRCVACGRVFGEDNRCPSCNAVAGVIPVGEGYACAACRAPRALTEGTAILAGEPGVGNRMRLPPPSQHPHSIRAAANRGKSAGMRLLGALSIGVGVLLATLAAILVPGTAGLLLALVLGAAAVAGGALALRSGAGASAAAKRADTAERELSILQLAEKSNGDLTVTEVAQGLSISIAEADASLTAMADGSRVSVEIDPDGILHFVFRELRLSTPDAGPKVRVEEPGSQELPVEAGADASSRARTAGND